MERFEKPHWLSEEPEREEVKEGGVPEDINLGEATQLILRLSALDTLNHDDALAGERMVEKLRTEARNFKESKILVPETLVAAIGELEKILHGTTRSVREEYAHQEAEPPQLSDLLAEAGKLELEIIEQEASGRIKENLDTLRSHAEALLPRLDAVVLVNDEDTRSVLEGQQMILRKFLRAHS